jgi:hypothetical protein
VHIKYKKNESYFDIIDDPTKSYWLGFLFADGYNSNKSIILDLSRKDNDHLLKFSKLIFGCDNIKKYERRGIEFSRLEIHSKKMCESLSTLGCVKNKTKILEFPKIEKKYIRDFLRGYFDGDGSIYQKKVPTRSNYTKFTSSKLFINEIKSELESNFDDVSYFIEDESEEIKSLKIIGDPSILKLYFYLYEDSLCFLERKKDKFESIISNIDEKIKKTIKGTRGYPKIYLKKYEWYINEKYNLNIEI